MKEEKEPVLWETVVFPWGAAIRQKGGKFETLFLKPNAQEIDVSELNVLLHDNGIEFVGEQLLH